MISIIIPVYNVEKYVRTCVESVLRLKIEIEILLIDDGSTDTSGRICDDLAKQDSRITVIHQKNKGLSEARNTGLQNAHGDYILFLDSDDFIDPLETDNLLKESFVGADVILGLYCNYYEYTSSFEPEICEALLNMEGLVPIHTFLENMPKDGQSCYMVAWRFVVRRDFLQKNNLVFFPGIYHEDEDWSLRTLCAAEQVLVTHYYFYQYRQDRKDAITATVTPKHIWDKFLIMEREKTLLNEFLFDKKKETYIRCRMAQLFLSNMLDLHVLGKEERKKAYNKLHSLYAVCKGYFAGPIGHFTEFGIKIWGIEGCCFLLWHMKNMKVIVKGMLKKRRKKCSGKVLYQL